MEGLHPDFSGWILEYGYGTVLSRPGLTPAQREIVAVAVLTAGGWERQLESHLRGALNAGADPGDVRRAVRQAGALAGPREGPSGLLRKAPRVPPEA
jgi:4-carboxymuconolactone decarboxylase